ncbi:alkaline phosphatase PhoX [Echinicola vietnamensis]|uniref:Putative phosphatase n=1 Tax=Echinicola vietnamensis (strain DSM 17526 / LMG 23754 / KMM 6221) TaxID=926556 RepID=L0FY10_ECHVK|nr:alkaline phosphatase PhoX [Echinicola vietnamensis]AGA78804.1 putative phosphatase [Echinicola vietnamensis DSM 17526]
MRQLSKTTRRSFLKKSGIATVGFMGLYQFVQPNAFAGAAHAKAGYGALLPDPAGILNLPKGFSYKVISKIGQKMSDGLLTPGNPDGMGTFKGENSRVLIVRNHEISPDDLEKGAFGKDNELFKNISADLLYETGKGQLPGLGGTTTLVYNPKTQEVEDEFLSLAGTVRNCAGGITPWNSWLTCEESTVTPGSYDGRLDLNHGYVFEVNAAADKKLNKAIPIKEMGRFNHEAVAVDPKTSIVYLTEDRGDGLFYRFIPNEPGKLYNGGKLQALAITGENSRDTRNWSDLEVPKFQKNHPYKVTWIDLEDIDAPDDDLRHRGFEQGAACFARGEGIWFGDGELFFACTNGGEISAGQVFRYTPGAHEGKADESAAPGTLELFAEPNDKEILKSCDNVAIAPWGDLLLCEDDKHPFVVGITPKGEYYKLAENVGFRTEFAGGVFSPDGSTYFVNIQGAGLTLAITGPWGQRA